MKKIVLVLVLIMIGVSCKKEDIKPKEDIEIVNKEDISIVIGVIGKTSFNFNFYVDGKIGQYIKKENEYELNVKTNSLIEIETVDIMAKDIYISTYKEIKDYKIINENKVSFRL